MHGAGRYRGEAGWNVPHLNERHLRRTQIELLQTQTHTVIRNRPENTHADFLADQIGGRLDRRMDNDHLSKPIEPGNRDHVCAGHPRVNRLRPAGKTKLHVAAQQHIDRSSGNINRFHAQPVTAKRAGLHTEGI